MNFNAKTISKSIKMKLLLFGFNAQQRFKFQFSMAFCYAKYNLQTFFIFFSFSLFLFSHTISLNCFSPQINRVNAFSKTPIKCHFLPETMQIMSVFDEPFSTGCSSSSSLSPLFGSRNRFFLFQFGKKQMQDRNGENVTFKLISISCEYIYFFLSSF